MITVLKFGSARSPRKPRRLKVFSPAQAALLDGQTSRMHTLRQVEHQLSLSLARSLSLSLPPSLSLSLSLPPIYLSSYLSFYL